MSYRRDHRAHRAALFDNYDNIEEGGISASSSYPRDLDERDNDKAVDSLQDRVSFLKRLTGDIHEEVENHNRMLDRMGNEMDSSRGIMSGTMDRFKMVFEKKSNRKTCKLVGYFVLSFFLIYYIFRFLMYFMYG
ncbi:PREDICTED: bet1-like SNARE 1-2 [Nicotiana attenuata]|uniref:Bet1-like snare 1-2 n=1 Tax=Nicotiana attenuata TaxID=49451 RepID=A0A314KUZ3_NICAT|nr:PREDICTED: bet1-like SNARE 1-2 [Nicotiana attenuata]OIT33025.1 bet1-like snare 1-2 [Nicotiana attenuata]